MISKKNALLLGCGMIKLPRTIGIDFNKRSKADIIHDLNKFPYPFKANQFEKILADHILEHLDNIPRVMQELFRISKNDARILINSSHFSSVDSFNDPTHKHFFTSRSFDYFIPGEDLFKYQYSNIGFKKVKVFLGPADFNNIFIKLILRIINQYPIFYEKRFAFIFPIGSISYELEVIKKR